MGKRKKLQVVVIVEIGKERSIGRLHRIHLPQDAQMSGRTDITAVQLLVVWPCRTTNELESLEEVVLTEVV